MKKLFIKSGLLVATAIATPQLAMAAGNARYNPVMDWALENILLIFAGVIIFLVGGALWKMMDSMVDLQKAEYLREHGIEMKPKSAVSQESFFDRMYEKAWSLVPMDKEADIDLGHDYDGIRELDNSLPPWWLYLFYFTIAFGLGYLYVYQFSDIGLSQQEEYEVAMIEAEEQRFLFLEKQANAINENNVLVLADAAAIDEGKDIYIANCAACHAADGGGGVGPNFTDEFWLHGGGIKNIYKTIKYGVPEKGMISWKTQLQPAAMQKVASFIMTLQGTSPANPKKAQGDLWKEETVLNAEAK